MFILVKMDDIIITGNSPTAITSFIKDLDHHFSIKDLGPLHYFLGVEVSPSSVGLHLSQIKYARDLLHCLHLDG